jgi:hypothetical protein
MGLSSIHELEPDQLVVPAGFHRSLGLASPVAVNAHQS